MTDESAWITGLGASTPVGNDFESIAANLLAGRSGIRSRRRVPGLRPP